MLKTELIFLKLALLPTAIFPLVIPPSFSPSCMHAKSLQLCPTLCNSMDCNLPGSSLHGILQARRLEWVAISFSRRSSQSGDETQVSCIAGRFFTTEPFHKHYLIKCLCADLQAAVAIIRRRQWHPTPVPLPGKSHGWRSLVGCCLWGHTELDTLKRLSSSSSSKLTIKCESLS